MKRSSLPLWLVAIFLYAFLYAPIVVVMVYSFNAAPRGVQREADPVDLPLAEAGEVERGLPEGLRGDARVADGDPSRIGPALDDGHGLAEPGGLGRGLLTGRAGPDHHQVERFHLHPLRRIA